jgi:hypothetical protein
MLPRTETMFPATGIMFPATETMSSTTETMLSRAGTTSPGGGTMSPGIADSAATTQRWHDTVISRAWRTGAHARPTLSMRATPVPRRVVV